MRAGFYTFQPESTRIKASPKRENPKETKDLYRLRIFFQNFFYKANFKAMKTHNRILNRNFYFIIELVKQSVYLIIIIILNYYGSMGPDTGKQLLF